MRYTYIYIFTFLSGILPFAVAPYLANKLSVEEFGYYNLFQYLIYFILPFITIGYQTGLRKLLVNKTEIFLSTFKIWATLIFVMSILILLSLNIISIFSNQLFLNFENILLISTTTILIAFYSFITVYWDVNERFLFRSFYFFIINLFIYFVLIVLLYLNMNYYSRIYAQIFIYGIAVCLAFYLIYKEKKVQQNNIIKHKNLLKIGFPVALFSILDLLIINIDKIFILMFVGNYELGLYSAYFYFYIGILFGTKPMSSIIETYVYKKNKQANLIKISLLIVLLLFFVFIVFFHSKLILLIFGLKYVEYSSVVIVLTFAAILRLLLTYKQFESIHYQFQYRIMQSVILVTSINVLTMIVLIYNYSLYGASIGILLANLTLYITYIIFELKYKKGKWYTNLY